VPTVRGIFRYPIKGLSPQAVHGVELEEGKPFPFDRVFALARPGAVIDAHEPRWAKKGRFLMLMLDEALARVRSHVDPETLRLTLTVNEPAARHGSSSTSHETLLLELDLGTPEGRAQVAAFFHQHVPGLAAEPTFVHARDGHFMDKPENVMSCINLATVRQVEKDLGMAIDPLRFRANFYIDGLEPWEEFGWIGGEVMLGDVLFRVDRRNGRCGAINVNPASGARDLDLPNELRKRYGHKDLGVYLVARQRGKVVIGDQVVLPAPHEAAGGTSAWQPPRGPGSFICRGCYYIFDEAKGAPGVPAGATFAAIPEAWRCPDCGTERANFRPYHAAL